VSVLDNIPRRGLLGRDDFWSEHVLRAHPVIIRGLMDGEPIARLSSVEAAVAELGSMRMPIRYEYTRSLARSLSDGPQFDSSPLFVRFAEYWDYVSAHSDTPLMCTEEKVPQSVSSLATVPALCTDQRGEADPDLKSNMFVGNAGNYAPMHFDGDFRHVLLYQLFGRKRVIILDATCGDVARPIVNFATLQLQRLSEAEKLALLREVGAFDAILHPGEAVLIPAATYHYVEYLDHGMSLNFRFGRNRQHAFWSEHLHLDTALQYMVSRTLDEGATDEALVQRIAKSVSTPAPTAWAKYVEMAGLFRSLADELGYREKSAEVPTGAYAELPDVVRACLLRLHLFNERLYRAQAIAS